MNSSNLIQAISVGICTYAGILHLFIGIKDKSQPKIHLAFGSACLLFSGFTFFLFNQESNLNSSSATSLFPTEKWSIGILGFILLSLWLINKIDKEEKLIQKKDATTKALMEAPSDLIVVLDKKGTIHDVNETFMRYHHKTHDELVGSSLWDLFPAQVCNHRRPYVDKVFKSKKRLRIEDEREGIFFDNILYPILDQNDKAVLLAILSRDITAYKTYEKQLKERTELLKRAQQIGKIGHWHFNVKDNTLLWSNEIYRIFALQPNEFKATYKTFLNMVHKDDREIVNQTYASILKTKESYEFIYRIQDQNDNIKYVREKCQTEFDSEGKPVYSLGTIQDITELKKAEDELIKAKEKAEESDKLKSSFLANISHEIRTPMNCILGFSDLLKNTKLSKNEKSEYLDEIAKGSTRMLNIINDLIDISNIEAGEIQLFPKPTSINVIMDEMLKLFTPESKTKNIDLIVQKDVSDESSIINIDKDKITKALVNLISNALKFTDTGTIAFGYMDKGDVFEFFVKDTGIGIPPEKQTLIFDNFGQVDISDSSRYEGAGLGLSISKAFIEAHQGKIWLTSKLNYGSSFYFTLPTKNSQSNHDNDHNIKKVNTPITFKQPDPS